MSLLRVVIPIWDDFTEAANRQFVPRIDGEFTGTTGETLTWSACKWGLDADIVRTVAVQKSHWRQSTVGDKSDNATDCVGGATPPAQPASGSCSPGSLRYIQRVRHCFHTKPWLNGTVAVTKDAQS